MSALNPAVLRWLAGHRSTISVRRLDQLGVSRHQRARLVRDGVFEVVVRGVYRRAATQLDELQRCAALCAAHPELVIGRPTAARLWGIRGAPRDKLVHATAPSGSHPCRADWLVVSRCSALPAEDVVKRADGIRVFSPPRAVVELWRYCGDDVVDSAVEWILAKRWCGLVSLRRVIDRLRAPSRPWAAHVVRLLDARLPGAPRESGWERRVIVALHARGLTDVVSQVRSSVPGLGPVRFDLAVGAIRWVLEVDVHPSHRSLRGQARDHRRSRRSRRAGWWVEQVGELELTEAVEETMDETAASARARRDEVERLRAADPWSA